MQDKEEEDEESGKEEDDSDKEGDNSDAKGDPEFNDRVARLKKSMAEYHKGMAMLQEQMAEFKMLLQVCGKPSAPSHHWIVCMQLHMLVRITVSP